MGALAGLNDLVNRATGGNSGAPENIWWSKGQRVLGATGITFLQQRDYSLWMYDGQPGGPAAIPPTTAIAPDNTTDGSLKQADATGGRQKWLTSFGIFSCLGQATYMLYDRLLHISGLSGTVTTAQTVGGAITRYTEAESWGNQIWFEIYTDVGATPCTISCNYTDQDGVARVSGTSTFGSTNAAQQGRASPIPMVSGGFGARGVTDATLSATTGTAGNFGITIVRPLAYVTTYAVGGGGAVNYLEQIAEIKPGACLALMILPHTVHVHQGGGYISTVQA